MKRLGRKAQTAAAGVPFRDESDEAGHPAAGGIMEKGADRPGLRRPKYLSSQVVADIVMCVDAAVIFAASLLAEFTYISLYLGQTQALQPYAAVGAGGAVAATFLLRKQGLYNVTLLSSFRGQLRRIATGLFLTSLLLVGTGFLLKVSEGFSRGWFLTWFGVALVGLVVVHLLVVRVLQWLAAHGWFSRQAVIYGSGEVARGLIRKIQKSNANVIVIGVFDDAPQCGEGALPVAGGLSDLISFGQSHHIDEILIAMPMTSEARIANLVEQLSLLPVDIRLCPSAAAFRIPPRGLLNYEGLAVLELERRPLDGWGPILKTLEDRILGSLALVGLSPLLLLIAIAIKLDSRGPVLFKQRRHGFNHDVFQVCKFRTMYVAEDGAKVVQATRDDPRVTRVGRFLRRTSLDELPQLFNVVKGEMSLVGPRPHALSHNEYYSSVLARYASRHKVKPGITGWAQINGFRGETDTPEKMRLRVEHDLYYIENWSIWLDLKILFATPFLGFVSRNAY